MEEDSYDLAVDGDQIFTCIVHSSHYKYNLSYGQVDAVIDMKESFENIVICICSDVIVLNLKEKL